MNDRCKGYFSCRGVSPAGRRSRDKFVKDCSTNPPSLRKVGETDQYGLIQSYKDECDIQRIVARAQAGDASVLQRVQGLYFDCTAIPSDPTEVMQSGTVLNNAWESLTPEQRAEYGNKEAFLNALLTPAPAPDAPVENTVETEVKTDEPA